VLLDEDAEQGDAMRLLVTFFLFLLVGCATPAEGTFDLNDLEIDPNAWVQGQQAKGRVFCNRDVTISKKGTSSSVCILTYEEDGRITPLSGYDQEFCETHCSLPPLSLPK
jgi:hypothetical protein